ncbi:MAG TPA: VOC family protein [Candidatus Limnocylindrales bacterium]|nr:VOC family protein [Candidatus Limnocylindrales bacterium]
MITGTDHVQLAIPDGGEDEARAFYGGLLGLTEVPKPAALAGRGGCWFAGRGVAIHLGVERPFVPAKKAHVALLVDDLPGLRGAFATRGVEINVDDAGIGVRRFHAFDPFGNRLEFVDARDAGFTNRG